MKSQDKKVWLITGASTGFGKELAKVVIEKDDIAVATSRKQEQADDFTSTGEGKLGVLIDVTDKDQVFAGIKKTLEIYGQVDVLVNNAGYGSLGSIERNTG